MPVESNPSPRRALINPTILKWARESTLLDLKTASKIAHISDSGKFAAAEDGTGYITFRQLDAFARACRIPLRVFYQKNAPNELRLPIDFRSAADEHGHLTTELIKLLRGTRERQRAAVELLADLNIKRPALPQVSTDRDILEILTPLACATYWEQSTFKATSDGSTTRALAHTKAVFEDSFSLLVFEFSGDITHVRGCSLYDDVLPVVLLSSQDSPNARRFTLVHEVVHLLLRQSGMCSPISSRLSVDMEKRCNAIAGAALMPEAEVRKELAHVGSDDLKHAVGSIAKIYRVSHSAAAVRMNQLDLVSPSDLRGLLDFYGAQWATKRAQTSESSGGPNYHLLQVQRLGATFTSAVLDGIEKDIISITQGANLLGVTPSYRSFEGIRENLIAGHRH